MDDLFLVYAGGDSFLSRTAFGKEKAFDVVVQFAFGEPPDPIDDKKEFDELVSLKNDFENEGLWMDGGNLWEADFQNGYVVVVRIVDQVN